MYRTSPETLRFAHRRSQNGENPEISLFGWYQILSQPAGFGRNSRTLAESLVVVNDPEASGSGFIYTKFLKLSNNNVSDPTKCIGPLLRPSGSHIGAPKMGKSRNIMDFTVWPYTVLYSPVDSSGGGSRPDRHEISRLEPFQRSTVTAQRPEMLKTI